MDGVGTSIAGRPRRLSADRRARSTYTFIWEEPLYRQEEVARVDSSGFYNVSLCHFCSTYRYHLDSIPDRN